MSLSHFQSSGATTHCENYAICEADGLKCPHYLPVTQRSNYIVKKVCPQAHEGVAIHVYHKEAIVAEPLPV